MKSLVVDKNFLQGSSQGSILELAEQRKILFTEALFYELLTTGEPACSRCFAKFPQRENPVELVPHVGQLLKVELGSKKPLGLPSDNTEKIRFVFDERLRAGSFELREDLKEELMRWSEEIHMGVRIHIQMMRNMPIMFPRIFAGKDSERKSALVEREQEIAEDHDAVSSHITKLDAPSADLPLPPKKDLSPDWIIFRWWQVHTLLAIDGCIRYRDLLDKEIKQKTWKKLENDVLDADYLITGLQEGSFATREKKLQRWWRLLNKDGELVQ